MDTGRYMVLLVDDDLVQIDLARHAAAEFCPDIELTAVAGGDAVLDWIGNRSRNDVMPHIIMMDLKLPKLDGLAVLRKLRGFAPTRDIPIVVCSAEYTQADVQMSYMAGANSFVAKPASQVEFAECFHERLAYWLHPGQRKAMLEVKDSAVDPL